MSGPGEAPGGGSWRLRPGLSLCWHWRGPPSVRLDIPPLPCTTHSTGCAPPPGPSCRALPLRERALLRGRAASPDYGTSASPGPPLLSLASLPCDVQEVRPPGRRPSILSLLAHGESMCSAQEPRETSLQEKGVFLDQVPGRARNPPSSVLRSWPGVGRTPRPRDEVQTLSKGVF